MKRRSDTAVVLFDVIYTDGTQSSNRKVLSSILASPDGLEAVRVAIETQDRERALASGREAGTIGSIVRKRA